MSPGPQEFLGDSWGWARSGRALRPAPRAAAEKASPGAPPESGLECPHAYEVPPGGFVQQRDVATAKIQGRPNIIRAALALGWDFKVLIGPSAFFLSQNLRFFAFFAEFTGNLYWGRGIEFSVR